MPTRPAFALLSRCAMEMPDLRMKLAYVRGAERMITGARLDPAGLVVRFADETEGVVPFETLELVGRPDHVVVPNPYVMEVHMAEGSVERVPWDFVRHFIDPEYRVRSKASAERGNRTFGERLKELRAQVGMTQAELADRAGVNRVTIARYETGEQTPRYTTLTALADALELPVERLMVG